MKKLMFFALVGIMLAAVSCGKDKDSSSDSSGSIMEKANENISKQISLAKEMTAALEAGDQAKQEEIIKQWIPLREEAINMGKSLSESQIKELDEKWDSKFKEPDVKRGDHYLHAYVLASKEAEEKGGTVLNFTENYDGSFDYRISTEPDKPIRIEFN